MPLTIEQIDAAKAELATNDPRVTAIGIDDVWYERHNATGRWHRIGEDTPLSAELWPALDRALSRAHLAEARRLGVPAWTLEELDEEFQQWLDESEFIAHPDAIPATEFLTHLKSLPNA